jgi:hypothetical protein
LGEQPATAKSDAHSIRLGIGDRLDGIDQLLVMFVDPRLVGGALFSGLLGSLGVRRHCLDVCSGKSGILTRAFFADAVAAPEAECGPQEHQDGHSGHGDAHNALSRVCEAYTGCQGHERGEHHTTPLR